MAIRLSLPDVRRTGRVVGLIYAFGTLGSLVGNFLTGFVLTAFFPVDVIVAAVAVGLLACALAVAALWRGLPSFPDAAVERESAAWPGDSARAARAGPLDLRGNVPLACAVVIVSSFCTMAIELAASRIMAPSVGLSLYTWTGIFGAVLAGIAVGNYLGGRVADRWSSQAVLGWSLLAGGLASLAILAAMQLLAVIGFDPLSDLAARLGIDWAQFRLMGRIVVLTAAIFFVPVLLLGMISPQVIRLAVTDLRHAGRVAGIVYAWSTAGAIVGTFLTGWWLISALGVRALVFGMGLILVLLAVVVGRFWARPAALVAAGLVTAVAVAGLWTNGSFKSTCTSETNYFCIKVYDDLRDGRPVKSLVLDHLVHSYVRIGEPSYLGYEHEYVQAEITRYEIERTGAPHVLVIGGGGYTYPRWVEWALPQASIEVVEIDPGVTEAVYEHLGLPRETRIASYNLDGRQFVHETAPKRHYAVVVQDAVNDLSVPYHIMTREYNDQIREILAPDGAYLLTVIDLYRDGQLLRAAARTMLQTFPNVQLLAATRSWDTGGAAVWVLAGSQDGIDLDQMRRYLATQTPDPMRAQALEPARLRAYVDEGPQVILTDQYAPVDNLIAPLFTRRG
jgi:spermidine synthase/MFS family permease